MEPWIQLEYEKFTQIFQRTQSLEAVAGSYSHIFPLFFSRLRVTVSHFDVDTLSFFLFCLLTNLCSLSDRSIEKVSHTFWFTIMGQIDQSLHSSKVYTSLSCQLCVCYSITKLLFQVSYFFSFVCVILSRLRKAIYGFYAQIFHCNLAEAELPLEQYPTLAAFFARRLKPGVRPIDPDSGHLVCYSTTIKKENVR